MPDHTAHNVPVAAAVSCFGVVVCLISAAGPNTVLRRCLRSPTRLPRPPGGPPGAGPRLHRTCNMCACRCGMRVHLKDGQPVCIDGNRDNPVNLGVLCAKGDAGLMNHRSQARREPFRGNFLGRRPRSCGALAQADAQPGPKETRVLRRTWPEPGADRLVGHTVRHAELCGDGGFCSVNMAAAGLYTTGGSFREFGEPDWDHIE